MEIAESHVEDQCTDVSIARGGPIYVPNLVSPLTGVLEFQDSVIQQLQNLRVEACSEASQTCDEDLSVDELKIFSEEELVHKALKEAFKGGMDADKSLPVLEELPNEGKTPNIANFENSVGPNAPTSFELLEGSSCGTDYNGELRKCNLKKRKKNGPNPSQNNFAVEKSDMAEVEPLVKIKQKQDEDKAAARLHSLSGSCKIDESAITLTEKDGKAKFFKSMPYETKLRSSSIQNIAVSYPEIVLRVEVYRKKRICTKTQEFLVLGRQTLTELRDNIYCLTDEVMQKAGQYDPSGYFLIEDVFCNDMRDPAAIDYSKPIFDWLKNSQNEVLQKWECITSGKLQGKHKKMLGDVGTPKLPRFRSFEMQKTRFCDLRYQLGAGYLYCHQGDCRHIIIFRDMRLIHPEDVNSRAAYPLVTYQQKYRIKKCSVCAICRATKVTVDDKFAGKNPCYFCEKCYFLLHYSEDQSLLYGGFSVYDYFHE